MQNNKITLIPNFIIAVVTLIGTMISMKIGTFISSFLPENLTNFIGGGTLITIGFYHLIKELMKPEDPVCDGEIEAVNKTVSIKESFLLAFALTINNVGMGVGAGISKINHYLTYFFTFLLSIFFIIIGNFLGKSVIMKILGKYADIISGLSIIIIGIFQIIS